METTYNSLTDFDAIALGVDSFSLEEGISTPSLEEAMLNQAMIERAQQTIAVFDSSKFNKRSFCHIVNVDKIQAIVTDHGLPQGMSTRLHDQNIRLYLA